MQIVSKIYDNYDHAKKVVHDLEAEGFPAKDISIVGKKIEEGQASEGAAAGAGIGAAVGGAGGLLAGLGLLVIPGLGPVVATGWLVATLTGAIAGAAVGGAAGGLIGSFTNAGIDEADAHVYAEAIKRGSTVVSAQVQDHEVLRAREIMDVESAADIAQYRKTYEDEGWKNFDPDQIENPSEEVLEERRRNRDHLNQRF